ncbi:hypothetical protein BGZ65_000437 [Modicella reniformis]|uniref:RNA polymerase II subunit B1 CTD phosphatase RPAP2 homolog n=1 Tax=Modicella reniformis TaxID=1440133 RepID=A0A9P6MBM6_9FUNG|nr:hypothetical protein BGZ65_000437 [Modicella reniformis]
MVLQWQEILCDPVDEQTLGEADMKGKFRISLQERRVYDITLLKKYCSSTCLSASRWFEGQLTEEPIYLNNTDAEHLKITRVSIVPLNMELAEFQEQRAKGLPSGDAKPTLAYNLPVHDLKPHVTSTSVPSETTSSTPSCLGSEYVQSLLATVPKAPSFVKIVEHDTTGMTPREPSGIGFLDHDMENQVGGDDGDGEDDEDRLPHDAVEGFRVPVNRRRGDVDAIRYQLSNISVSDPKDGLQLQDQSMHRSESSTSMDTLP